MTESAPRPVSLADLIDAEAVQTLMDHFYRLTGVPISIIDLQGNVFVGTGWQDVCTQFHRAHPEALKHCLESDIELSAGVAPGAFRLYRCRNNMWDMATPIVVDGEHVGNIFLGQFFFEDETPDYDLFREQARRYGFDEEAYLAALDRVPRWSRERVDAAMTFYAGLGQLISSLGYSRLELARALTEKDRLLQQLGESEERYRALVENAGQAIFVTRDKRLHFVNPATERLTGYSAEELTSRPFIGFVHPDDQPLVLEEYDRWVTDGELGEMGPFRVVCRSGEIRWVELVSAPVRWEGRPAALSLLSDVTERLRAERALQRERDFLRLVIDLLPGFVCVKRRDGRYVIGNAALARAYGATVEDLEGKRDADFSPTPEQAAGYRRDDLEVIAERSARVIPEETMQFADGTTHWLTTVKVPLIGPDGACEQLLAVATDITERKAAEDALRESEAVARALLDATPDAAVLMDLDGTGAAANQEAARRLGVRVEDMAGTCLYALMPPEAADRRRRAVEEAARSGAVVRFEDEVNGRIVDTSVHPIADVDGRVARVAVFSRDVSEERQAQAALRASEALLRRTESIAHVGSWELDVATDQLSWSEETFRIFGLSPEEPITFDRFLTRVHPDDRDRVREGIDAAIAQGADSAFTYRVVLPGGEVRHVAAVSQTSLDERGRTQRRLGSVQDITERVRAEEALRAARDRARRVLEVAAVMIVGLDSEGRVMLINRQGCEILGYDGLELQGKDWFDVCVPARQRDSVRRDFQRLLRGEIEGIGYYENPVATRTGEERLIAFRNALLTGPDGRVIGTIASGEDITERRRAERERERFVQQIEEQRQQLAQVMDSVPDGVILLDRDGRVILANPTARQHLARLAAWDPPGASGSGVLTHLGGRPLAEILVSSEEDRWLEVSDGDLTCEVSARQVQGNGELSGWVVVCRDVTQERDIQRRVQQQERLAAVGQLAAGIAHDFNNIMAVIVLYAEMMARSGELPERERERVATITEEAHHAARLIQQMLDFGRRAMLERRRLDLLPLVREQAQLLERALPENIRVRLACDEGEYLVNADPTRIQQMLMNLAVNARDAMPDGGELRIELARVDVTHRREAPLPDMDAGRWIRLTVADTGTGMSDLAMAHLFEPFFTTKAPGEGSGLGLAQVHGIVGQHAGHIHVTTQRGAGATFTIYLPASEAALPDASCDGGLDAPRGHGERVLLVEDNDAVRRALAASLQMVGYRVVEASDGAQALAMLEERRDEVDVILSDAVMPEMGGVALARTVRDRGWAIPVIIVSGHPQGSDLSDLEGLGVASWLTKPPEIDALAQALCLALRPSGD